MANNNHIELTLDTVAPTGSVSRGTAVADRYHKAQFDLSITKNEDATYMALWYDTEAEPTATIYTIGTALSANSYVYYEQDGDFYRITTDVAAAANTSWAAVTGKTKVSDWVVADTKYTTTFTNSGNYYYHLVLKDAVGNQSSIYNTEAITYDATKPVVIDTDGNKPYVMDKTSSRKDITNDLTNTLYFKYSDDFSGVVSATLTCADLATTSVKVSGTSGTFEGDITFNASAEDGNKTIEITVTDACGNVSDPVSVAITLDRTHATAVVVLKDSTATTNLPAYVNATACAAVISTTANDIVGYKIWGDLTGMTTEPTAYTSVTKGTKEITVKSLSLTSGDAVKNVYIKVIDDAGNEWPANPATEAGAHTSVTLDQTKPTASIEVTGKAAISATSNSEITYSCADAAAAGATVASGVSSYTVYCNDTSIASGSAATADTKLTISKATSGMVEGDNTFKIVVTDAATNSDTVIATGKIKLDTTNPTCALPTLDTWYNTDFGLTGVTYSDGGSGVAGLYVWVDTSAAATTTIPSGVNVITPATTIAAGSINTTSRAQSANNYMHLVAEDAVGNRGAATPVKFGYDNVAPVTSSVTFTKSVYSGVDAKIIIAATDATSGLYKMQVTGNITDGTAANTWEDFASMREVKLTDGDGEKSVSVLIKDTAGNIQAAATTATCELDTTTPTVELTLREHGTEANKSNPSNIATVDMYITYKDDVYGKGYYKVWGNGNDMTTTETDAEWVEFTPVSGTYAVTLAQSVAEQTDGLKQFSVRVKDNAYDSAEAADKANHISAVVTKSFVYDTTAINVKVDDLNHGNISTVHTLRRDNTGLIAGDYCDVVTFKAYPADNAGQETQDRYIAHKVVAYANAADAAVGSYLNKAIGNEYGSQNMSGSYAAKTGVIACTLTGKDFETALGATTFGTHKFDGTHIIVVYIQDEAGTWSEAAKFNA